MKTANSNPNRPPKGSLIAVDPIRSTKDIRTIKKHLHGKPRDLALFTVGINTNLRASDLVRITVGQVRDLKAGDSLALREMKTGKARQVILNKDCVKAISTYLATRPEAQDADPLFISQRGGKAITPIAVNALVKRWTRAINLKGNYGAHTLRKTWGYHQRVTFNVDIPTLMVCFGHATQRQTLKYLCIGEQEVKNVFANSIG
jgi:integrase